MIPIDLLTVTQWVVAIITAIGGGGGLFALIKAGPDRRKIIADATKTDVEAIAVLSTTAIDLVNSMRTQMTDLKDRITDLETRVAAAETRAAAAERRAEEAETRLHQLGAT